MANQQESKIEDFAFDYLKKYYAQQYTSTNILVGQEEKTKRGNTADGLLAFKKPAGEVFVSAISMQQSKEITNLLTSYKKNGLGKLRFLTPVLVAALCFVVGQSLGNVLFMLIVPVVLAPVSFMVHNYLLKLYRIRQVEALIETVKLIPADEKWIGLSISSMMFRGNALAKKTLEVCQQKGIGLITVGKRNKVVLMQRPSLNTCRRNDYLHYYASEESIRRAINEDHVLRVA